VSGSRVVLLNALPLSAFPQSWQDFAIQVRRVDVSYLYVAVREASEVKCYIRHPATVELLKKLLQVELKPSAELYRYSQEDEVFVITLKAPQRGAEVQEVKPEDLEIFRIVAAQGVWL
jgi:hypothetical protein